MAPQTDSLNRLRIPENAGLIVNNMTITLPLFDKSMGDRFMVRSTKCVVPECDRRSHARGYCRKHYKQIYHGGKIRSAEEERQQAEKVASRPDAERIRAIEREMERVGALYQNVIGIEGRLKWRRELDELKKDWDRLGTGLPAPMIRENWCEENALAAWVPSA